MHEKEEAVVGFFKIASTETHKPLERSGWTCVFFQKVYFGHEMRKNEPIRWIPFSHSSAHEYLRDARQQAKAQNAGLVIRRGGKSCLGLLGVQPSEPIEQLRRRWVAKGWLPSQLEEILQTQGWRVLGKFQPPKSRNGIWTFKRALPKESQVCLVLNIGRDVDLVISPWVPTKQVRPQTVPLSVQNKGWITNSKSQESSSVQPQQVALTQIEASQNAEEENDDMGENDTTNSVKRAHQVSPSKNADTSGGQAKKKLAVPAKQSPSEDTTGPEQVKEWDLGGNGDCGFRVLAGLQARRQGETIAAIQEKVEKLALSLRSKVAVELQGSDSWRPAFVKDPESNFQTEDGEPAVEPAAFVESVKRPRKWFDNYCCQAASNVVQTDIVVFKFLRGEWHFMQRFSPVKKQITHTPMPMFLKQVGGSWHFTTLHPDANLPEHWKDLDNDAAMIPMSFLGGVNESKVPDDTESVQSSSCSSWLKPCPSVAAQGSEVKGAAENGSDDIDKSSACSSCSNPAKVLAKTTSPQTSLLLLAYMRPISPIGSTQKALCEETLTFVLRSFPCYGLY